MDQDGFSTEKNTPEIHKDLLNTFIEWSDFVCFATSEDNKVTLTTSVSPSCVAKNRYHLPHKMVYDYGQNGWDIFKSEIKKGMDYEFETKGKE